MNIGSTFLSLLLLSLVFQSPQDKLKQHYEAAEAQARAAHFALREYEKAAAELKAALEFGSNDFDTSFTLAIAYLQQRQFTDARRVFDWMLQNLGDQPELHVVIGRAFRVAGRLPEAIDEFKIAIALNPALARVHDNLALAYLMNERASRRDATQREFKTKLFSNPDEVYAIYYLVL